MMIDSLGLYIHIPFCRQKCLYCDFCSFPGCGEQEYEAYRDALLREIRAKAPDGRQAVDSVFFGGGTPTCLPSPMLAGILSELGSLFSVSDDAEITAEANPATVDRAGLALLRHAGFNRLSIGVQSFQDRELQALGRIHSSTEAERFVADARAAGFDNINMDLMFGIPEQTPDSFGKTLRRAISLRPEHISAYGLMLEEGTPFNRMRDSLAFPSEEEEDACATLANEMLHDAGYRHYEISNFALPGRECRHNMRYWQSGQYLGFGVAAYSFFRGDRFGNGRDLSRYLLDPLGAEAERVTMSTEDMEYEYVMLHFRLADGVDLSEYRARFGEDFREKYASVLDKYRDTGHIIEMEDHIALSEKGMRISNAILVDLLPS